MSTLKTTIDRGDGPTGDSMEFAEMTKYPQRARDRCPTHPGAMIREIILPTLDATRSKVAEALGVSRQTLYDILNEKQPVTPQMAVRLGAVFVTSAESWLRMQAAFDLWHAERTVDTSDLRKLNAVAG